MTTLGTITLDCPICGRPVIASVNLSLGAVLESYDGREMSIGQFEVDPAAICAHLLTHGPHDGEPLARAA